MLLLALSVAFSVNLEGANAAVKEVPRATWLWNTQDIINQADEQLQFLADHQANIVYLQVNPSIKNHVYYAFIQKANRLNIEVHALDGASSWAKTTGQSQAKKFFDWVERYQKNAPANAKFTGIHLDVEPYTLKEWTSNYKQTVLNFQKLMVESKKRADKMKLPLAADIPFWFDEQFYHNQFGNGVLSEWMIDNTDAVAIMAYRNQAIGSNGIIELSRSEMEYAESVGKLVSIAVETNATSEGAYLTFYEESAQLMEQQLALVEQSFQGKTSFNGFSIHSINGWMELKK